MGKIIARFGPSGQADGICGMHSQRGAEWNLKFRWLAERPSFVA
jgi:hypothetical protein